MTVTLGFFMLAMRESRLGEILAERLETLIQRTFEIQTTHAKSPSLCADDTRGDRFGFFSPSRFVFCVAVMSAVAFGLIYFFGEAAPIVYATFGL